jgi:hypothetical protein
LLKSLLLTLRAAPAVFKFHKVACAILPCLIRRHPAVLGRDLLVFSWSLNTAHAVIGHATDTDLVLVLVTAGTTSGVVSV